MRLVTVLLAIFIVAVNSLFASSPQPKITQAIELYDMGQWVAAELKFREVRENFDNLSPTEREKLDYYLAMCASKGDNPEVESYFLNFERRYPLSIYRDQVELAKALYLCEEERYDEALSSFESVDYDNLTPIQREEYDIRMGYIAFWQGRYSDASTCLERIKQKSDLYHHALYYRSYINYSQDGSIAARSGFENLLESDAYSEIAPFYILHIDFKDGKYERVIEDGLTLVKSSTSERAREIIRMVAESMFKLERFDESIRYISEYEAKGGVMGREENYILGFSLYRLTRYQDAEVHLRAACGADDALTQNASYHLADCYIRVGDKAKAKLSFAMASNEKYNAQIAEDALFNYGKIEYELGGGLFNEAINILTRYIESYPNGGSVEQAKVMLIAAYYNSRDYDAAYSAIKHISNPDAQIRGALQKISFFRGVDAFNAGDLDVAQRSFQESASISISPKYLALSYFWQGEIYFMKGNYSSALNNYNTFISRAREGDKQYGIALYNIAYCYLMLGNSGEAERYFRRYVSISSGVDAYVADANNRLGDIEYGKRRFNLARERYALSAAGDSPYRFYSEYNMAIIDGLLQRYSSKEQLLRSIIDRGEGNYVDAAAYELGRTYLTLQQYANGVAQLESFIKEYPSSGKYSQALSDLGLGYLNLGQSDRALEYYDKAIKSAPNSTIAKDALLGIRAVYVNSGRASSYFEYAASMGVDGDLDAMARDSLSYASSLQLYLHAGGDYAKATTSFEEYLTQYPNGHNRSDALFFLSDCYIKDNNSDKAIESLNKLVEHGAGSYSERVYTSLTSLLFGAERYAQAAEAYLKLYDVTTSQSTKRSAVSGYVTSVLLSKDDDAIFAMSDFIANKRNYITAEQSRDVEYAKAKIYSRRGEREKALEIYQSLSLEPLTAQGAEATFIIVENHFMSGRYSQAEDLIFKFSESNTRQSYWLAKTFLILGDIYIKNEDIFQARATYQSIVDGYSPSDDGIIEQAKAKISNLPQ
ncbi:MAG: tetratricopeptide repeat protein [Rikenellaceae bacterium]